jgi:hypothetical protein
MPASWIDEDIAVGVQADAAAWSGWIVNVAQEFDVAPSHQQGYVKYGGVVSGMPILPLVRVVAKIVQFGEKVLIVCGAGMNRSPAVAICTLMHLDDSGDDVHAENEARRLLRERRSGCVPTESIIESYKREVG